MSEKFVMIVWPILWIDLDEIENILKDVVSYLGISVPVKIISDQNIISYLRNKESSFIDDYCTFQKRLKEQENYNYNEIVILKPDIEYQSINSRSRILELSKEYFDWENCDIVVFANSHLEETIKTYGKKVFGKKIIFNKYKDAGFNPIKKIRHLFYGALNIFKQIVFREQIASG